MSLLPGRILPQTEPFGTVSEDGKTVTIEKNWWLWAYNVSLQSIGTGTGIPADQLIDLESVDVDAVGVSAAALNAPIAALANLMPTESDPIPSLQDVKNALLLAYSALDAVDAIVSGFAAPSAKVGLTAVAGTAYTAMRSDAAPPLDQTIIPTMTGLWTFTPASAAAAGVTINGAANADSLAVIGSGTSGQSFGIDVLAGTTAADYAFRVRNHANTLNYLKVDGAGAVTLGFSLGVNGNAAPAQVTGFGTPTGAAVVANYPGATATLVQTSNTVAEILTILKAAGFIGA